MDVTIKKIKFTTINKTYTEIVRDWQGQSCFSTQYPSPDGKKISLTYYFVQKGYTISKVFTRSGEFLYYYCDIMKMRQNAHMQYEMTDFLIDLVIYPDGKYHVMDIDEFADAIEKRQLKQNQQVYTLRTLHHMISLHMKEKLIPSFVQEAQMYP